MFKLLKIFGIMVLAFVAVIGVLFALAYDGDAVDDIPVHLYHEDADAMALLYAELDSSIEAIEDEADADLVFAVHQDIINIAIFTAIRGDEDDEGTNPDYLPGENCETDDCRYISVIGLNGNEIRLPGIWVTFEAADEAGLMTINVPVEIDGLFGTTFRTNLQGRFILEDREDDYLIAFDRFRLGSLPLTQGMASRLIRLAERVSDFDSDDVADDLPAGRFDTERLAFTIEKDEISEFLNDEDNGAMMNFVGELVDIVFEERLLLFQVRDESIDVTFALGLIRNDNDTDIPQYLYLMHDDEGYNPELLDHEQYMADMFLEYVFTRSLTGEPVFTLDQRDINIILYDSSEGFEDARMAREYGDDGEEEMVLGLDAIWFDIAADEIVVFALFSIDSIKIRMEMVLTQTVSEATRVEYVLTRMSLGRDAGDSEDEYLFIEEDTDPERIDGFKNMLASLGDVYFGTFDADGTLIIEDENLEDMMDEGTTEGSLEVDSIEVIDDAILLTVTATDPDMDDVLAAFAEGIRYALATGTISGTLEDRYDPQPGSPHEALIEQIELIEDYLLDDSQAIVDYTYVDALFTAYSKLSQEDKDIFLDVFKDQIDNEIITEFEDYFM